jgi:hypothetical protein
MGTNVSHKPTVSIFKAEGLEMKTIRSYETLARSQNDTRLHNPENGMDFLTSKRNLVFTRNKQYFLMNNS